MRHYYTVEAIRAAEAPLLARAAELVVSRLTGALDQLTQGVVVVDAQGHPAPRLNDVEMSAEQARQWHAFTIMQIVRMLCAGLIHGDLSEYNVLLDAGGPVIIDLPQAVSAASNNNAFSMFERDVNNMRAAFARAAPELLQTSYAQEIWRLYQAGVLAPDTPLTGRFTEQLAEADLGAVLDQIEDARREAEARQRGREEIEAV